MKDIDIFSREYLINLGITCCDFSFIEVAKNTYGVQKLCLSKCIKEMSKAMGISLSYSLDSVNKLISSYNNVPSFQEIKACDFEQPILKEEKPKDWYRKFEKKRF